jgi:peptidoglycan-associated lipoprotein
MKKFLVAAAMAALLAGCSTQPAAPVEDQSAAAAAAAAKDGAATSGTTTSGVSGSATGAGANPLKDPNNILSKRSIYFEFDSFVVEDKYKAQIDAHAKYLSANRSAKVTLQGHTDERGSREYNIALGQKRADAVKRAMTLMGVQDVVIETVSYGKEKPKREGHDEAAWAENRRVDIVYFGE